MQVLSDEAAQKRGIFFDHVFKGQTGHLCIAKRDPISRVFEEYFYVWPEQRPKVLEVVGNWAIACDVYYCPTLFGSAKRTKDNVLDPIVVWADLDECAPEKCLLAPTFVVETSPNRYQALWLLEEAVPPTAAEDASRRIAYAHRDDGADVSGWDLTQLLRVPFTLNHKYGGMHAPPPPTKVVKVNAVSYSLDDINGTYPRVEGQEAPIVPLPHDEDLPQMSGEQLLETRRKYLPPQAFVLFHETPIADWSRPLFNLMMMCFEAGFRLEDVYVITRDCACNKFKRDNRGDVALWKDVLRAHQRYQFNVNVVSGTGSFTMPALLTDEERAVVEGEHTIVEEYIEWAKTIGDASPQYHQAGAFVLLSALLAGPLRLPTSFGVVVPNLWFMILADTTLTRKSTAMDLAVDLLAEIDSDAVLATDGSIEGLFTALSARPGRPSLFLRDEFSGLLEAISKKDYYAGMMETLTKLYDGKFQKRVLRKETIEVRDPVLVMFAGGIRDRILGITTFEYIASGFIPRFVFITAESDVTKLRPIGPPTVASLSERERLRGRLATIHAHYTRPIVIEVNGQHITQPKQWDVKLSPEAWERYNHIESMMMDVALRSHVPDLLTPVFDRLCKSGLKAAMLLTAAARLESEVVVSELDLLRAFRYVERWREYSVEVVNNAGKSASEKQLTAILKAIKRKEGILRSELMNSYHLDARTADVALLTLEQRGLISRVKKGRSEFIFPIQGA